MNRLILNFTNPLLKLFLFVFFLFPLMLSSQEDKKMKFSTEQYKSDWDKVSADETKGLPKSALEKVNAIYKKAKEDNNPSQTIKSTIYRMKHIGQVEEDSFAKAIEELQKETDIATSYAKPILHSILGEVYWQYYNNNRYYIMQRTKTDKFKQADLRTWDATKLIEAAISEYTLSTKDIETTKQIKIEDYSSILNHDPDYVPNGRSLRPTLFDFLAHRAVDFFAYQEHGLARPAETFIIDNPAYFSDIREFVKLKIETKDQMAYKYYALQILQDLARIHLADGDSNILTDIDLKRLSFVYSHSVLEDKGELYRKALDILAAKNASSPLATDVAFALATYWHSLAHKYISAPTEENKWVSKKAYNICESAIKKFPNSDGAQNCRSLQAQIKTKNVSFTMEKINIPGKPFLSLVNFKNLDTLYFKIFKINRTKMNEVKKEYAEYYPKNKTYINYEEILINHFAKLEADKTFTIKLPNDKDYMEHRAEVRLPELDFGQYLVLAGTDKSFTFTNQAVSFAFTNISNLTYIDRVKHTQDIEYYALNRTTGEPESGVDIHTYYQIYNNKKSRSEIIADQSFTTDKTGYFQLKAKKDYKHFYMTLRKGNDFLEPIEDYYTGYNDRQIPLYQNPFQKDSSYSTVTAKLFLDRAIYRPGQTIYFKGILVESNDKKRSIKPNTQVKVTFYNVNYQQVSQLNLTTNEYGTFSGSFTAPTNVLNGQMSLNTNYNGNAYFSVEEYKRPKFAVEFEKVKGTYKLGDQIKIKGFAKAFSGANIDNAEVKYRVVRIARYPFWWGFYFRGWNPSSPQMEIKQGNLKTDEKGYFEIEFEAIADKSVPKEPGISFSYQVIADVTDLNGETRSASGFAYVGYTSLIVNVNLPDMVNLEHKEPFDVITTNLNNEFEPAQGYITIHKLKNPPHAFRNKKWQRPDKFILPQKEYQKDFPNDVYDNEDEGTKWEKEKEVLNTPFNTEREKHLSLKSLNKWTPGRYVLEIKSVDKFGQEAKEIKYFTVYSENPKLTVPTPSYSWIFPLKQSAEPGETAGILVGSSENVKVLYELELEKKIIIREWISLDNTQKLVEIPIKEEYRGNITAHFVLVKDNQILANSQQIYVPYSNKELKLSFETFRNKLQPGEKEEWRIKIQGQKSEKVVSEMLATLYDASLDMFRKNYWDFSIYPSNYSYAHWHNAHDFQVQNFHLFQKDWNPYVYGTSKSYDALNWFGIYLYGFRGYYAYQTTSRSMRGGGRYRNGGKRDADEGEMDDLSIAEERAPMPAPVATAGAVNKKMAMPRSEMAMDKVAEPMKAAEAQATTSVDQPRAPNQSAANGEITGVKARTNFNETAFFFPHLISDKNGEVTISFTVPEALTKWKMMGFAHTKDLKYGMIQNELVTQKELMVVPNAPRFFREGDEMEFTTKITNLSDKKMTGKAQLEFLDAVTMTPIAHDKILKTEKLQSFESEKGQSTVVKWNLKVPEGLQAITYRVLAKSENFSDGEEMPLPVLTNRMLVTETLPLPMRGKEPKTFKLEKMINNKSDTLVHHKYTLEFTSNPAWYAVQALPYIMEYPYECAEQLFSRFYANSLASHIANSNPKIKKVFDSWKEPAMKRNNTKEEKTGELLSNLEKNQELKSLMLEETPWVLDAQDETERKKRVGLLFDLAKMTDELERALDKLMKVQSSNGGFAWFAGMQENRYITQHIVTGIGHLDHLGVKRVRENSKAWSMTTKAVQYLDWQFKSDYDYLVAVEKKDKIDMSLQHIGYLQIQYLYARSFFKDVPIPEEAKEAFEYYKWQAKTYWTSFLGNKISTGMIALALNRMGEATPENFHKALSSHKLKEFKSNKTPEQIVKSLREHALNSEEMGMYFKQGWGYYWYELPIETQSLMIEVFDEVAKDEDAVNDLKTWLLKQKQTQDWKTTKATSEAIYALLLKGEDWLSTEPSVEIKLGSKIIDPLADKDINPEAGTGYFKKAFNGSEVTNDMGNVLITPKNNLLKAKNGGVSWGAVYWQYFEQLDKITPAETPLKLQKKLFLQENTKTGPVITPIDNKTKLKPGDLIKVRIELRVDRDMEFVHMKDMRAASFEPTNVISRYKWQDGLGYYESTRDAATNFFFDSLPKGTYVFEYPLRVTHKGNYSNGITTIQSMYAPEFTSHSEGVRVKIGE
jgi:uncharacterized protein YfaS (alpha-2-macroglobulin family)